MAGGFKFRQCCFDLRIAVLLQIYEEPIIVVYFGLTEGFSNDGKDPSSYLAGALRNQLLDPVTKTLQFRWRC
jgi:hypothetical protein